MLQGLISHARKNGDKKGDLRELLDDFEAKITEAHQALRVEERNKAEAAAAQAATEGQQQREAQEDGSGGDNDAMDVDMDGAPAASEDPAVPPPLAKSGADVPIAAADPLVVRVKVEPGLESSDGGVGGGGVEAAAAPVRASCGRHGGGGGKRVASRHVTPVVSRRKRREVASAASDDDEGGSGDEDAGDSEERSDFSGLAPSAVLAASAPAAPEPAAIVAAVAAAFESKRPTSATGAGQPAAAPDVARRGPSARGARRVAANSEASSVDVGRTDQGQTVALKPSRAAAAAAAAYSGGGKADPAAAAAGKWVKGPDGRWQRPPPQQGGAAGRGSSDADQDQGGGKGKDPLLAPSLDSQVHRLKQMSLANRSDVAGFVQVKEECLDDF